MESGSLFVQTVNGIATVEFFHPASNSLPSGLLDRLAKAFNELSEDKTVKVVVLKSEKERAFCAGASLAELLAIDNPIDGVAFFSGFGKVVNAMRNCKKPIIGRVQGKTVGGGVGIAAACDYVFATEQASIKLSEISIGIGPFVVEPIIRRKIGVAAVGELALDPEHWKNAYWAKEKGLYAKVLESLSEVDKEVQIFAEKLASYSPDAVQHLKRVLWESTEHFDTLIAERAQICGHLVLSDTTKKALEKFRK
jgi:methylglutaconyl-CoA hydratase